MSGWARHWWLGLVLLVVVASAPALTGGWVYDDWGTLRSTKQDGVDDLLLVFERDSGAYMNAQTNAAWPFGVTYRPLSAASIIAVQAFAPRPFFHHLVSLALHLACALALARGLAELRGQRSNLTVFMATLFALHPVNIEAYGYINGRSDVLAGAFLGGLLCFLPWQAERAASARLATNLALALCAAGAALSKEPAVAAVLVLTLACACEPRGFLARARLRLVWPALTAVALGLGVALLMRALVVSQRTSGLRVLLSDPQTPAAYARALSLAVEHLLLPLPRAMLSLSFELSQPSSVLDWLALAFALALGAALLLGRQARAALLVAGALAGLLPVLPVRQLVWLGFDRYLYIPLFLLCCAVAALRHPAGQEPVLSPTAGDGAAASHERTLLRFAPVAALLALLVLGASSFATAQAYRNQEAWLESLVRSRPEDPSGWIMAADWFFREKQHARASAAALAAPREGLAPPLAHDLAMLLIKLSHKREAVQVFEAAYRAHPNHGLARFDALVSRGMQGRFDDAYALARELERDPMFCSVARDWIRGWLEEPDLPPEERPRVAEVSAGMRCPDPATRAR